MKIHVVQKGDTLWELAKQYDVDFEELKQLNSQLSSPDMIMPGMKIKIPSSVKSVQKEEVKETQKPDAVQPDKEMQQPKPVPIMEEDEKEKQKQVQPHMPEQPHMPKEQQQNTPAPQLPEQPQMPAPEPSESAPQLQNQQPQPIIQMPIMEQELKNYMSVQVPEMPQYQKSEEKPNNHEKPVQQPMHQQPMAPPVVMIPVCCQVIPPGAQPMAHQPFPPAGVGGDCAPFGQPIKPQGYPHSGGDHDMKMESPSFEMPVKPSLMKNDKDCGCGDKKSVPTYHHNVQEMHHQPYYNASPHHFSSPFSSTNPYHSSVQPQPHPPYHGAVPNHNPFPTPPGYPHFSGASNRMEEDESSSEKKS